MDWNGQMVEKKHSRKNNVPGSKAQAIVEFAIVLPILMAVLVGILEVGRYILIYSAATNASRNAVRYASAVGRDDAHGLTKYNYCEGIKQVALDSTYLVPDSSINVVIDYIDEAGAKIGECNLWNVSQVDTDYTYGTGDRVQVTVTMPYKPMVNLVPIKQRIITSVSTRTILGIIELDH